MMPDDEILLRDKSVSRDKPSLFGVDDPDGIAVYLSMGADPNEVRHLGEVSTASVNGNKSKWNFCKVMPKPRPAISRIKHYNHIYTRTFSSLLPARFAVDSELWQEIAKNPRFTDDFCCRPSRFYSAMTDECMVILLSFEPYQRRIFNSGITKSGCV